jgi:tRNA A37 threonylcarbamoyladenosine dehydratase
MERVRRAFVIVVGLGGVGVCAMLANNQSHAAHMLLRAGVENVRLIDFDQV